MLHNIFVKTVIHFIFQDSQINRKLKRTAFICNICNIINVFTVTFDSFNASLMNKSIFFTFLNHTYPKSVLLFPQKCFFSIKSAY